MAASQVLKGPVAKLPAAVPTKPSSTPSRKALYASKIVSYAQGFALMRCRGAGIQAGDLNYGGDRPDVARRLHHPQRLPGQDQGGLRPRTRT